MPTAKENLRLTGAIDLEENAPSVGAHMNRWLRCMLLQTLLLLTTALGCFQTQSKVMESWRGQSGDRLTQSWGAPDRSETLSDGTRVLTWVSVWADQQGQATCRKSFTLNKGGTVERWSFS